MRRLLGEDKVGGVGMNPVMSFGLGGFLSACVILPIIWPPQPFFIAWMCMAYVFGMVGLYQEASK